MKLILDREENGYVVLEGNEVVSRFWGGSFRPALERAEQIARGKRKDLYVTKSCMSDWYVGVPKEGDAPEIFYDTRLIFAASLPENFKYIEGPFFNSEEASQACLKLTGKIGQIREV